MYQREFDSPPNAMSLLGVAAFAVIFWGFVSQPYHLGPLRGAFIVGGHFAAMVLGLLAVADSYPNHGQRQFGVLALLGGSAVLGVFCSLVRICLLGFRVDNLDTRGWIALLLIVSLTGWALLVVLAEATATVVWWLALHRKQRRSK